MAIRCFFPLCRSRSGKRGLWTPAERSAAGAKQHGERPSDADVAAASRVLEEGGVVRVKIVMTKGELRRIMASAGLPLGGELPARRSARRVAPESLDELRVALRSWHLRKEAEAPVVACLGAETWSPALQTIPEEALPPAHQLGS